MKNVLYSLVILLTIHSSFATSNESNKINDKAKGLIEKIFNENASHVQENLDDKLTEIQDSQAPRATVLSCSDSRVQSETMDATPVNDLFYVRNIGNQIDTAKGSIQYGIKYLNTPVLLIIGHVDCGAIKAAVADYSGKPEAIRKELDSIKLPKELPLKDGVIYNVHNQVHSALETFKDEIQTGELVVIGAIYDFKNEYKQGFKRLVIINLNGEKDPSIISKSDYLSGIKNLAVGTKN